MTLRIPDIEAYSKDFLITKLKIKLHDLEHIVHTTSIGVKDLFEVIFFYSRILLLFDR